MDELERLKLRTGEADTALLGDLLESAKSAILARRAPFGAQPSELEARYLDLQVRIAEALFNKRGADGQTSHTENGVARVWATENIPSDLLAEVTPLCVSVV